MNEIIAHIAPKDSLSISSINNFLHAYMYDDKINPCEWGRLKIGDTIIRFLVDIEIVETYRINEYNISNAGRKIK